MEVVSGAIAPSALFDCGFYDPARKHPDVQSWLAHEAHATHEHAHHQDDITSFCIVRDQPLHAVTLALMLSALAENCGADLLRMKGIVQVVEDPARPAVIHGVQHVFHAPAFLERWPSADQRSRIVFIARGIPRAWVESLLAAIEEEVAEVVAG